MSTVPCAIRVGALIRFNRKSGPCARNQGSSLAETGPSPGRRRRCCRSVGLVPGLDARGTEHAERHRGWNADAGQRQVPARLDRRARIEAREQVVPGDRGGDRVDPPVTCGGEELDAAAVAAAGHPYPRVATPVPPRLRLLRHVVDEGAHVAALEARVVDHHGPARAAESAGVPGEDVVAGRGEVGGRARLPGTAPSVSDQDRRRALARLEAGGREEVGDDRGPVERLDDRVAGVRGGRQRQGAGANEHGDRDPAPHRAAMLRRGNGQCAGSPRGYSAPAGVSGAASCSGASASAAFAQWFSSRRATTILCTSSGPSAIRSMRL